MTTRRRLDAEVALYGAFVPIQYRLIWFCRINGELIRDSASDCFLGSVAISKALVISHLFVDKGVVNVVDTKSLQTVALPR